MKLFLIGRVFFEPMCKILYWFIWLGGVDVSQTFGNDFSDIILLEIGEHLFIHVNICYVMLIYIDSEISYNYKLLQILQLIDAK